MAPVGDGAGRVRRRADCLPASEPARLTPRRALTCLLRARLLRPIRYITAVDASSMRPTIASACDANEA